MACIQILSKENHHVYDLMVCYANTGQLFIYFILLSLYHNFRSLTVEEDCGGDTDETNCTATNLILLDVFAVDSKSFTISGLIIWLFLVLSVKPF